MRPKQLRANWRKVDALTLGKLHELGIFAITVTYSNKKPVGSFLVEMRRNSHPSCIMVFHDYKMKTLKFYRTIRSIGAAIDEDVLFNLVVWMKCKSQQTFSTAFVSLNTLEKYPGISRNTKILEVCKTIEKEKWQKMQRPN